MAIGRAGLGGAQVELCETPQRSGGPGSRVSWLREEGRRPGKKLGGSVAYSPRGPGQISRLRGRRRRGSSVERTRPSVASEAGCSMFAEDPPHGRDILPTTSRKVTLPGVKDLQALRMQNTRRPGAVGRRRRNAMVVAIGALILTAAAAGSCRVVDTTGGASSAVANLSGAPAAAASIDCRVAHVTDGDTLRCEDGTRIRLHAVSARESDNSCRIGHPCSNATAAAATAQLTRLVADRSIRCEPIGRSYGRVTAVCWTLAGEEINCAMVRSGNAALWPRFNRQRPICDAR